MSKVSKKRRMIGNIVLGALLAIGALGYYFIVKPTLKENVEMGIPPANFISIGGLGQYLYSVEIAVKRTILRNKMTIEDVYKLDFSEPGTEGYGVNPEYGVFHPLGGGSVYHKDMSINFKEYADDPKFIFTVGNRVSGMGTDKSDLIMVFPHIYEAICKRIHQEYGPEGHVKMDIPVLEGDINLMKFSQVPPESEIATLPEQKFGCVRTPSGLNYYYVLYAR